MLMGLLWVLATGVLWGALGAIVSRQADRETSPMRFFSLAYVLAALGVWLFVVDWNVLVGTAPSRLGETIGWSLAAGVLSAAYQLALQPAMRRGSHAVTWACTQSALVASFLAAVMVWGERVAWPGWVGLAMIAAALVGLGRPARGEVATRPGWRRWVAVTWLAIAAQQITASVPSHWSGWSDAARLRPVLAVTGTALVLGGLALVRRHGTSGHWPWWPAFWFAVCADGSLVCLYRGLDGLAAHGAAAVAFPLAVGTSIVVVSLWRICVRGERPTVTVRAALCVLTLGVLLLALSR